MSWSVTTPPVGEPVTLDEAKQHLRVDVADDDVLIEALIEAARQHVEAACQRALMPQVWTERVTRFPAVPCNLRAAPLAQLAITLAGGKVRVVDSVKYVDTGGVLQTLDPAAYVAELTSEPAWIVPAYGMSWPATREQPGAVQVQYQVGYTDAASVPAALKAAILLIVGDLYANREATIDAKLVENRAVSRLLFPYKRVMP